MPNEAEGTQILQITDEAPMPFPTEELINEFKTKYKKVFTIDFVDTDEYYIFRRLTRPEYRQIMQPTDDIFTREETICRLCVIFPKDMDWTNTDNGGLPSLLSETILLRSGLGQHIVREE